MIYHNINLAEAPSPAFVLCIYTDGVEFGIYTGQNFSFENRTCHLPENMIELHIFDCDKEFRAVYSQSRDAYIIATVKRTDTDREHQSEGIIEENKEKQCYRYIDEGMHLFGEGHREHRQNSETSMRDKGMKKTFYMELPDNKISLYVRNYLTFDKNHMVVLHNYRLLGLFNSKTKEAILPWQKEDL